MYRAIVDSIPQPVKECVRPAYEVVLRLRTHQSSRDEVQAYWRNPPRQADNPDENQAPEIYMQGWDRSEYLAALLAKHFGIKGSVMEIGCNVGRNLECLRQHGYGPLGGIEISPDAIAALRKHYPELGHTAELYADAVENVIKSIPDNSYDVVCGVGAWQHIHRDSDWVFGEIARVAKHVVITMEDEHGISHRNFQRNYARVFKRYGFIQEAQMDLSHLTNMGGEGTRFIGRVMRKKWAQP